MDLDQDLDKDLDKDLAWSAQDAELASHLAEDDESALSRLGSQEQAQAHAGAMLDHLSRMGPQEHESVLGVHALLGRLRQSNQSLASLDV